MIALRKHLVSVVGAMVLACTANAAENSDWSTVAKWPDFTGGVWGTGLGVVGPEEARGLPPPKFKPGVEEAANKAAAEQSSSLSDASCDPHGLPTDVGGEFFFTKGALFLMTDLDYLVVRRIDMVRKEHGDPELTYYGDSLGHWEGRTLVVDSTGFRPEVPIAAGVPGNSKTEVIERFKMTGPDKIELEITVVNPDLLVEPYITTRTLTRHPDWTVHETYCKRDSVEPRTENAAAPTPEPTPTTTATPTPSPTPSAAPTPANSPTP